MKGKLLPESQLLVVHADESCLGNQTEGPNPGGAGALVESAANGSVTRHDFYLSSSVTTNNRMALSGALELLKLLDASHPGAAVVYHSDSQYLVKGITDWVYNWERRGWRRKGGAVENLELWQELLQVSRPLGVDWRWVRGHVGLVKNEYADHLAVSAAEHQSFSEGLGASEFHRWLAHQQSKGKFSGYDPDSEYQQLAKGFTTTA